ncbi:transposase [Streptomyces sp. RLB1-33]|nr:transposase [Streptomyces sp. RLB1-33]
MVQGLLMVKDSANCWSLAEAIGHTGPHVLQHFLSRARFDTEAIRRTAAAWTVEQLGSTEVMLVVDETGDEKSSTDAVGAARQYSGALGARISITVSDGFPRGLFGRVAVPMCGRAIRVSA